MSADLLKGAVWTGLSSCQILAVNFDMRVFQKSCVRTLGFMDCHQGMTNLNERHTFAP